MYFWKKNLLNSFFDQNFISRNQKVELPMFNSAGVEVYIKREDEIHHHVSGNKFRKLKYNLIEASRDSKMVLTFGGAFSNHIVATAFGCRMMGLKSIGIIRGEELGANLAETLEKNTTLRLAYENGMQFEFISRTDYRNKNSKEFLETLHARFGDIYVIPEGGTNKLAIAGASEILTELDHQFDYICCCVGTGGTITGLIASAADHQKVLGYPALKGDFLEKEIQNWIADSMNWSLVGGYHFGGYAKYNLELIRFINDFKHCTGIPLDPIYTGKMLFGIIDGIKNKRFERGAKILAIHTGGLQGIDGFNQKLKREQQEIQLI